MNIIPILIILYCDISIMIIIKDKKLCFVHIFKTSGSTLTALMRNYIDHDVTNNDYEKGWQQLYHYDNNQHNKLIDSLRYMINKGLNVYDYRYITICRDPYDWIGSIWSNVYTKSWNKHGLILKQNITFRQFVSELRKNKSIWLGVKSQTDFIQNNLNIYPIIYKFENNPIKNICKDFNIKYDKNIKLGKDKTNKSLKDRFRYYNYTINEIKKVNYVLNQDFFNFGYKMYDDIDDFNKHYIS